ncbi:MAG: hypothetical protein PHF21_00995 [Bacilli bacterium]|nr:hypothetical protein [Bacilli bacterium]
MNKNIKIRLKRGKESFLAYLNSKEDEFTTIANKYNVDTKTLQKDLNIYINRIINPKPTQEELEKYYSQKNIPKKINKYKRKEKEAFNAFLETNNNSSAIVDLAIKEGVKPEIIRNRAFDYFQNNKTNITKEKQAIFLVIHQIRKESFHKEMIDFKFITELLNMNSNFVLDYLDKVINENLNIEDIQQKINLYIKYHPEETKNINKLDLIYLHIQENIKYIENRKSQKIFNSYNLFNNEVIIKKTANIIKEYLINEQSIKKLLNKYNINISEFNQGLTLIQEGTLEETKLFREFQNKLNQEKNELTELVKLINYYLDNGISKNMLKKDFTILDYYRIINQEPEEFLTKIKHHYNEKYISFNEFNNVNNFLNDTVLNNKILKKEELLIDNKLNFKINMQDKLKIIDYLEANNIPLYLSNYFAAIEEFIKGELTPLSSTE